MRVFLDTQVTPIYPSEHEPKIISIGLYTEDCRRYFYAELKDNYTKDECSEFEREFVLPLLDARPLRKKVDYRRFHGKITRAQCPVHLATWFEAIGEPIEINSVAPDFDWPLLTELFQDHPWPAMLQRECRNCYPSQEYEELYLENKKLLLASFYRRHHALDYAKVMALCNMIIMTERGELVDTLHLLWK